MIRVFIFSAIVAPFINTQGMSKSTIKKEEVEFEKIAPDVYVATDKLYFNSRVLIVKMEDGSVVIASSPFESIGTRYVIDWINLNLKPTKVIAINTHFHLDGTGGNEVFHAEGVETWASHRTAKMQMKEGVRDIADNMEFYNSKGLGKRLIQTKREVAKNLFSLKKGKEFNFSGERVKVFFPGHAHSPDNVVVYFPHRKLLFGGCMIKSKDLGYMKFADAKSWISAAEKLAQLDVRIVVPGHDPWGGPDLITKTIQLAKAKARK